MSSRYRTLALCLSFALEIGAQQPPADSHQPAQPSAPAATTQAEEPRKSEEQPQQQPSEQRQPPQPQAPEFKAPILYRIEGKVVMRDGGPPPDRVNVGIFCAGATAKTLTDAKGNFSLSYGFFSTATPDASVGLVKQGPGQPSAIQPWISGCELRAYLPGFRADTHTFAGPTSRMRMSITLHPLENVSGYTFSATSLSASNHARKAYEKGSKALKNNKLEDAERELRRAVQLHPQYAIAWYDLGRLLVQTNRRDEGTQALESAARSDPKYISPYPVLAQLAFEEQRWDDLARHTETVIGLNPFLSANIYLFSAQANLMLRRLEIAERHAREAVRMDSEWRLPIARRLFSRILAQKGELGEAINELRLYLEHNPTSHDADQVRSEIIALKQRILGS